jgi:hypothetical protein
MAMASGAVVSDLDAFEQAVRSEGHALYSLARAILGDQQEAEDAVQDTMELPGVRGVRCGIRNDATPGSSRSASAAASASNAGSSACCR